MHLRGKVMRGELPKLTLLVYATFLLGPSSGSLCQRGHTWWSPKDGVCLNCTACDHRQAVLTPCELHRDTRCIALQDLNIWPAPPKRRRHHGRTSPAPRTETRYPVDDSDYEYVDYGESRSLVGEQTVVKWDFVSSTLTLAGSGCVLFFVVVVTLSVYHARQWKRLKLTLQSDVEDLSAKLKLMESGEGDARAPPADHLYCNIQHGGKDTLSAPVSAKKGFGNVYTQEKHST